MSMEGGFTRVDYATNKHIRGRSEDRALVFLLIVDRHPSSPDLPRERKSFFGLSFFLGRCVCFHGGNEKPESKGRQRGEDFDC